MRLTWSNGSKNTLDETEIDFTCELHIRTIIAESHRFLPLTKIQNQCLHARGWMPLTKVNFADKEPGEE
jgi:hypothetical protein